MFGPDKCGATNKVHFIFHHKYPKTEKYEDAPMEIEDLEKEKPAGWLDDKPEEIDDPESTKPDDDWDDDENGHWEAPKIPNPICEEAPGCGDHVRRILTTKENVIHL
eukprot:Gb_26425 [translate_table: standard]